MRAPSRLRASRALATCGLIFSFYYATWRWPWLLMIFYPVVGPIALAALVGAQVWVMSRLPPDPVSRALDILAWGLLVVPVLGLAFRILTAASHAIADGMAVEGCGSTDAAAVMMLLRDTWPVSALGEALVLATIDLRRDELRALSWQRRLVTLCTLLACPPLAVVTAFVAAQEYGTGGPGAVIFYPATIAAGATLCAWTAGGRWPAVHALRVIAGIVVVLGVTVVWPTLEALDLALGLPLDLGSLSSGGYRCASFWDSPAWSLVSMRHQGWVLVVVGVLLLFARNPEA